MGCCTASKVKEPPKFRTNLSYQFNQYRQMAEFVNSTGLFKPGNPALIQAIDVYFAQNLQPGPGQN